MIPNAKVSKHCFKVQKHLLFLVPNLLFFIFQALSEKINLTSNIGFYEPKYTYCVSPDAMITSRITINFKWESLNTYTRNDIQFIIHNLPWNLIFFRRSKFIIKLGYHAYHLAPILSWTMVTKNGVFRFLGSPFFNDRLLRPWLSRIDYFENNRQNLSSHLGACYVGN